jgi:hypothetical protein
VPQTMHGLRLEERATPPPCATAVALRRGSSVQHPREWDLPTRLRSAFLVLHLVFYEAGQFRPNIRVRHSQALKGSWNVRSRSAARSCSSRSRCEGFYENFATGFWTSGEGRAEVLGRGARGRPGSRATVADGTGGTIWRIVGSRAVRHTKPNPPHRLNRS